MEDVTKQSTEQKKVRNLKFFRKLTRLGIYYIVMVKLIPKNVKCYISHKLREVALKTVTTLDMLMSRCPKEPDLKMFSLL